MIALVTVFVAVANVFVQSGLNTALIQKKNADNIDFSTVFYASLGLAFFLYGALFLCAPFLAKFYNNQVELVPVIRVLGLMLLLGAVNSIQEAYVARNMMFKKLFYRSVGAIIPAGVIGVILAYMGFGVWSLVAQQLFNSFFVCVIMWFTVKWRPSLVFSFERWKQLFSFGWKLLCSTLLDTVFRNLQNLIIGKFFSSSDLGFYNRGDQFPHLIVNNVNASVQSVMLPSFSSLQDDLIQLKKVARRAIATSSFVILPLMAVLAAVAEPLTIVVLGEKWLPAVPFIRICCFSYAFWPIHTTNLSAINAVGRSDVFLKLEFIKKGFGFAVLLFVLCYFRSPIGIALGSAVTAPLGAFVNVYPNKKLLNYGCLEQMKDVFPSLMLSLIMGLGVYFLSKVILIPAILQLGVLTIIGLAFYVLCAKMFRLECFDYILKTLKEIRKR